MTISPNTIPDDEKRMTICRQLSVVIPAFNRATMLGNTLQSLINQYVLPQSIILVDNASTDETPLIMRQFAESYGHLTNIVVLHEPTPGACSARNRGLSAVETPWVMFFDSDDIMLPGHIRRVASMIADNKSDIVGWDIELYSDRSLGIRRFYTRNALFHNIMHGSMSTQRYAARTELFRRAGAWDVDVPAWNDVVMGTRLLLANPTLAAAKGSPTIRVNVHNQSITGTSFAVNPDKYLPALNTLRKILPPEIRHWACLKESHLAGLVTRAGDGKKGQKILQHALSNETKLLRRILWRLVYAYTAAGGRGAARLVKPLI